MLPASAEASSVASLASSHGLHIERGSLRFNDMGLDFRVATARDTDGNEWLLRLPRRPDAMRRAEVEGRFLSFISSRLSVSVPDWQVHAADLIAYPLLPGTPGLTLDDAGAPVWHVDSAAPAFTQSLADFLAELHSVDIAEAASTGIEVRSPAEVREGMRRRIARVTAEFEVANDLTDRWSSWLADDSFWPAWSTVTHGEIYPAHVLHVDGRVVSVLDWTTAAVGDPAKDFMFHQSIVPKHAFDATISRYVEHGGRVWPKIAEHCAELLSTAPVEYGVYAIETQDPEHVQAAAAQLNPAPHAQGSH